MARTTEQQDAIAALEKRLASAEKRLASSEREHVKTLKRLEKAELRLRKQERRNLKRAPQVAGIAGLAGLQRDYAILDVGCGPGRLTRELVTYLTPAGVYHGIEVQRKYVEDLRRRFGRLENFHFHHADLANTTYNPNGSQTAETYTFPLESATIDRVVLLSIFTHLLPEEVDNYLGEIARVLRPGGRAYITWFLLDDASRAAVRRPADEPPHPLFRVDHGDYWVRSDEDPGHAVAFELAWVRDAYERHGLRIMEPITFGAWSVRPALVDRQDIVVAERG
jgi:SAM-dependent methyltransferase